MVHCMSSNNAADFEYHQKVLIDLKSKFEVLFMVKDLSKQK